MADSKECYNGGIMGLRISSVRTRRRPSTRRSMSDDVSARTTLIARCESAVSASSEGIGWTRSFSAGACTTTAWAASLEWNGEPTIVLFDCLLDRFEENRNLALGYATSKSRRGRLPAGSNSLRKAVDAWCQACRTCAARNEPTRKAKAPLQMPEVSCAFQTLAMDFLGPLEATPKGYRYILVVCDYFSKWTEAYPTRSQAATEVSDALVGNWFSRFGAPIRLHSNQGRSFESALISEVCKIFGVEKSRSSPYHPQGNGLVERANRTLLNTLAKLCHESQDRSWDQLLPLATMAYNSAVHETTGQSPFCMLFGKQMSLPLDVTLDVPPGTASNADDYVVQLRENLQKLHSTAFDRSRHEQQRHKEIADRKATANRFETGQLVWLKVPQKGKMDMRWSGPFRVLKQLGVETYRVQDVGRPRRRLVVHSDRLKAYHTGIDQEATAGGSEPPGGSGDVLRTTWTFKGPVVSPGMTGSHAQEDVRP
ncbi:Gag-Uncharacterized protein [Trichinella zimbabwensis]|uniref:Gag-Uncharacterized protein n=1 Tax=Trichinella zimbabwensis TaxID=268475 RepID=A0A0V1I390_9BILA|nr:Gag-Uncharacterized protein [Trichinella zimbabwensis]